MRKKGLLQDLIHFSLEHSHAENCRKLGFLLSFFIFGFNVWYSLKVGRPFKNFDILGPIMISLLSLAAPQSLKPIAIIWFGLSWILHFLTNPIILIIVFYGAITPIGFFKRIFEKKNQGSNSYWIKRSPPGPYPKDIHNQF